MASIEELLSMALAQGQQQVVKDDPYAGLAQTGSQIGNIFAQATTNPNLMKGNGTRDAILGAAISGLFGGAMGGLSSNYQADRTSKYNDLLLGAMGGQDVTGNRDVTSALARTAQTEAEKFKALQGFKEADDLRALKNQIGLQAGSALTSNNPSAARDILSKVLGVPMDEPAPIAKEAEPASSIFGNTGTQSIDDKIESYAQGLMAQGTTPNAAYERASQRFKAERDQDARGLKKIEDSVKSAQDATSLVDLAEYYVQNAGDTGGLGGVGAGIQNKLKPLYDPKGSIATQDMDTLAAKFLSINRPVGAGATDRFEAEKYIKGGISSANEPETNTEIIRRMRYLTGLDQQYAEFLDAYRGDKGTLEGADTLWSKYTQSNPAFIKDPKGEIIENPNIKSWDQWLVAPSAPTQATSGNVVKAPDGQEYIFID